MNESTFRKCLKCRHSFHARESCGSWGRSTGPCGCDGIWDVGGLDLSGYCFAYNHEEAQHDGCPGEDYTYPCQCPCHGDPF